MSVEQSFNLDIVPQKNPPRVKVTEYDQGADGWLIKAYLFKNGERWEPPSGATVKIEGTTYEKTTFTVNGTVNRGSLSNITFTLTEDMTGYKGLAWAKAVFTIGSSKMATCGFWLDCDRAGVEADTVIGAPGFEEQIQNAVDAWLDEHGASGGGGLTDEAKQALLNVVAHIGAWSDDQGRSYYDALYAALYPPVDVLSISAVFTQGSAVIYDTDSLNTLKQYLVVTATMTDSTTQAVTNYTLSGTLTVGTSTITVSYGGKTATFNVIVSAAIVPSEYQQVEWIGTTQSITREGPYINTGLTETTKTDINGYEVDVSAVIGLPNISQSTVNPIFGWGSAAACYFGAGTSGVIGFSNYPENAFDSSISAGNKYDFHVYWDSTGGNATSGNNTCARAFSSTVLDNPVLHIGTGFYSPQGSGSFKIYGNVLVKKNSTIVGNFYPCYRKSDNVIGFYDTVSENFYTNAGAGSFEKGGDIS